MVTRTDVWIALAVVVLGGIAMRGWQQYSRRAWPTSKRDESMRRHVNKLYD
jgi:hypothetical protein